jgi:hypothetical protein
MKFDVPKKLRSYIRSPEVSWGDGDVSGNESSELFLLALSGRGRGSLTDRDLYRRVSEQAPNCMPYFLEQLVPFPVLAIQAGDMSDWGAVVEARKVSQLTRSRFVLTKRYALRGIFGQGGLAVAGLGGDALMDLSLALQTLPLDDSWVQASLLPQDACAFQTTFIGPDEYLGLRSVQSRGQS